MKNTKKKVKKSIQNEEVTEIQPVREMAEEEVNAPPNNQEVKQFI